MQSNTDKSKQLMNLCTVPPDYLLFPLWWGLLYVLLQISIFGHYSTPRKCEVSPHPTSKVNVLNKPKTYITFSWTVPFKKLLYVQKKHFAESMPEACPCQVLRKSHCCKQTKNNTLHILCMPFFGKS